MATNEAIEITKGFLRFNNKACSQAPTQVEIEAITSILSILDSARAGEHAKSLQESPESYRLDALDWRTEPNTSEQMALHCEQQVSAAVYQAGRCANRGKGAEAMSAIQCLTCRWWNGDKSYASESFTESDKHGNCSHIVSSSALSEGWPVRLYPIGTTAYVSTRYDFSCRDWEKEQPCQK